MFTALLAERDPLGRQAVEALVVYAYNRQGVAQEIVHPDGQIEYRQPLQPDLLAGDTSRLLYRAVAWYQKIEAQLKGIDGDWESWTRGVFSFLRCEEGRRIIGPCAAWTTARFHIARSRSNGMAFYSSR